MRIRPVKFVHVVYRTRRFEEMPQWYETVFGAKIKYCLGPAEETNA